MYNEEKSKGEMIMPFIFTETAAAGGTQSLIGTLFPFILVIVVFYFLMIRPENKKKKEVEQMRSNLKIGDNITTIGGVIGDICHLDDENLVIEVGADRVRMEFAKWAVSTNNTAMKDAEKARLAAAAAKKAKKEKKN